MISMTGKDLILYILANGLEDKPVFDDGKFIGFITAEEYAIKNNVGKMTVCVWIQQGLVEAVRLDDVIYIPANAPLVKEKLCVK